MKTYKCPHCADLGIVWRCRSGADCVCAMLDSGVACTQGMSYKCVHCNPLASTEIKREQTAHIL